MSDGPHIAPLVALAAGGTGGHMFPAEALAQELKRRGFRVLLVTDARGARYAKNFPADERFEISAASPSVGGPIAKVMAALSIAGGLITSLKEFRQRGVRAAVGFGGYPSLPAMKAASILGLAYGVHEQNGVLGRANRMLVGKARFVAHGFANLARVPSTNADVIDVGNPVRDAVSALMRNDLAGNGQANAYAPPTSDGSIRLLVFGGSQGAAIFSRVIAPAIGLLRDGLRRRLMIVQQVRDEERASVEALYQDIGINAELAPFFGDLPARIQSSHLVIARSGASTVTELSVLGRPSILVPLAIAMDDHQTGNARALADKGGAVIIPEAEFTPEKLASVLNETLGADGVLEAMASKAAGCVKTGAAASLADLVERKLLSANAHGHAIASRSAA